MMLCGKLESAPVIKYLCKPLPGPFLPFPLHKIGSRHSLWLLPPTAMWSKSYELPSPLLHPLKAD